MKCAMMLCEKYNIKSKCNPFNSQQHTANADVIAVVIWEKSSSCWQKMLLQEFWDFQKNTFSSEHK